MGYKIEKIRAVTQEEALKFLEKCLNNLDNSEIIAIIPLYRRGIQFGELCGFDIVYLEEEIKKEGVADEKV